MVTGVIEAVNINKLKVRFDEPHSL